MPFTSSSQGRTFSRNPSPHHHHTMLPSQKPPIGPPPRARLIVILTLFTVTTFAFALLFTAATTAWTATGTTPALLSPATTRAHTKPCPDDTATAELTIHAPESPFPLRNHAPHLGTDGEDIAALFRQLTRATPLSLVSTTPLQADTQEPEGMVVTADGSHLIISSTPKDPEATGPAMLLFSLPAGALLATLSLTSSSPSSPDKPEPHNGGLDSNATHVFLALSGSRPETTATIYSLSLADFALQPLLHFPSDHVGTLVAPPPATNLHRGPGRIAGMNWGSRTSYSFPLADRCTTQGSDDYVARVDNPSHFVDYQDCKLLTETSALCSGVSNLGDGEYRLGGLALVDVATMRPLHEVPVTLGSEQGTRMTMNPFDVAVVDGKLTFYWAPDQHNTSLYTYQADIV